MIRFLSIRNVAVVDSLELELGSGLTVLTGETGAGKSIVVGAISLLAGGRASADVVRTGQERAQVQASVEDDQGEELVLRRDVTAQGRSRAFVDDALSTVGALQKRALGLFDLHGQHEHQALLDPSRHLGLLDAYGGLTDDVRAVTDAHDRWTDAVRRLDELRRQAQSASERSELLTLQRTEIDEVAPVAGEDETLARRLSVLANAERLSTLSTEAYEALYERDDAVLARLGQVWSQVQELADLDPQFLPHLKTREAVESQLEDLAFALRSYASKVEASPDELESTESRLAALERLKRRHGPTLDDVLRFRQELDDLLGDGDDRDMQQQRIAEEAQAEREVYHKRALALSERRRDAARRLTRALGKHLAALALPKARFAVGFGATPADDDTSWRRDGLDDVEFRFSANPGEDLRPLARVASGGELSRVMLALKTLVRTDGAGKTLVFDEVDAGIGGAAADRVGAALRDLATRCQVICVTHLPQIAAYATTHHRVSKAVSGRRTTVRVERLEGDDRAEELARMMTGAATDAALAGAAELLQSKQRAAPRSGEGARRRRKAKSRG